ncbi:MAG TPA: hypothetical protein VGM76_14490 [Lacipirellulaceae bacterium]
MKWQRWIVCGLSVAALAAGQFARGQNGRPSKSDLQQMGLGGISVMSDDDALAVRGFGFSPGHSSGSSAVASGNSFATINTPLGSAHTENSYASSGKNKAGGDNFSFAGFSASTTSGNGGKDDGHGSNPGNGGYGGSGPPMGGNGGYGGNGGNAGNCKSCGGMGGGMSHPPKNGGGYGGNGPPSGGMGGNGPPKGNGGYGGMGGNSGGMGGKTTSVTFTVFAGGSSHAYAH